MSAEVSSVVQCSDSPTGLHEWLCITIQPGMIVGVDSTGAPVFIPDDTAESGPDSPSSAPSAYGCAHCETVWDESLTTT